MNKKTAPIAKNQDKIPTNIKFAQKIKYFGVPSTLRKDSKMKELTEAKGNIGYNNSGNYNIGGRNSGNYNNGNRNSGDYNKCNFSNGCFNTVEPKIYLFNKPSESVCFL